MTRTFNLNHYVYVQLNAKGREVLREYYAALSLNAPPVKEDTDGWSKWQLWDLMQTFGPSMGLGMLPPFSTEIRLEFPGNE